MLPSLSRERRPDNGFFALQSRINRMFDEFFGAASSGAGEANGFLVPATDVRETDKTFEVQLEMPGVDIKDVEVSYADGALTVRAEKRSALEKESEGAYVCERSFGSFRRSIALDDIDADKIDARLEAGVLKITLPKLPAAQSKARKIPVRAVA
ncbi:MAG: Hsp20/alpha crystallin family protein [Azospirillum sp.]|nr:Hsp20/alpha crystallin family protein [Azospirillum sp.]